MSGANEKAEFAGRLDQHIRIERPIGQRDVLGATNDELQLIGEYWAGAEAAGTNNESASESRSAMQLWTFTLRQTDEILPGDQLTWGGRTMLVRTVSVDLRLLPKTKLLAEEKR